MSHVRKPTPPQGDLFSYSLPLPDPAPLRTGRAIHTLADVVTAIDDLDLTASTRRVLKANTRTAGLIALAAKAREDGRSVTLVRDDALLATVPASPAWLNRYLFAYPAGLCGATEKLRRLSVVGLRRALRGHGLIDPPTNSRTLPPDCRWRALLDRIEAAYAETALATFAVWCHGQGVEPEEVAQRHLEAFEAWLTTRTLHSEIPRLIRNVGKAWRQAAPLLEKAGDSSLDPPPRRETYVLRLSEYSESLQEEVAAFLQWYGGAAQDGPFRRKDAARRMPRQSSVRTREYCLRQALTALVLTRRKTPETVRLKDLIEPDGFEAVLRFHWDRAVAKRTAANPALAVADDPSIGVTAQTAAIGATLMILARHYFKLDAAALKPLRDMAQDVTPPAQAQLSRKNLDRLRQLSDPVTRAKLLHLPQRLRELVEGGSLRPLEAARMARVAVAIEILLHIPLRNGNLCMLRLGVHLRQDGGRAGEFRRLVLQRSETKNSYDGEWPIGEELRNFLAWYVENYLPLLAAPGSDCLFPAGFGKQGPLSEEAMYASIVSTVADQVGVRINPHLFRAICASFILERSPGALEDVRLMIGDKSLQVVLAHYAASEPQHAARRTDELLEKLRTESLHHLPALTRPNGRKPR